MIKNIERKEQTEMLEENKNFEIEDEALEEAAGGATAKGTTYYVKGVDQYLAMRTACEYKRENEICGLKNKQAVTLISKASNGYWLVYSKSKNTMGFVNSNYLTKTKPSK